MSAVTWVETVPSNGSAVGRFPPFARSVWTAIESALSGPLQWPDGTLAPGALPAFSGVASSVSNPGAGYLAYASDTSRLYTFGSSATYRVGDAQAIHGIHDSATPAVGRLRGFQSGSTTRASGSTVTTIGITFPTAFVGLVPPTVLTTFDRQAGGTGAFSGPLGLDVDNSAFTVTLNTGNSNFTLHWSAFGDMAR